MTGNGGWAIPELGYHVWQTSRSHIDWNCLIIQLPQQCGEHPHQETASYGLADRPQYSVCINRPHQASAAKSEKKVKERLWSRDPPRYCCTVSQNPAGRQLMRGSLIQQRTSVMTNWAVIPHIHPGTNQSHRHLMWLTRWQTYKSVRLCRIPLNWWTHHYEMAVTSSWFANGTQIFPWSSISSSWRHRLRNVDRKHSITKKLYSWHFY